MDAIRERFLRDRVLTATPAQRVVMLYDRLALDLARARTDAAASGEHLDHATQIVAELLGSLDRTAGGPAENLAMLYGYMLRELMAAQLSSDEDPTETLRTIEANVWQLRDAWAGVAGGAADAIAAQPALAATGAAGLSWTA